VVAEEALIGVGVCNDWALISDRPSRCFYGQEGVGSVIEFDQVRRVDLISWFPGIVAIRVSFPFDKVLELL
jgi:hypothetical protein